MGLKCALNLLMALAIVTMVSLTNVLAINSQAFAMMSHYASAAVLTVRAVLAVLMANACMAATMVSMACTATRLAHQVAKANVPKMKATVLPAEVA